MNISNVLGYKYVLKNQKKSLSVIISIAIATILVTTSITLLSSYQKYLVAGVRKEKNWEIELQNIHYSDYQKIVDYSNIKELSIYHKLGISEEDVSIDSQTKILLDVREYDENALKNSNIKLLEGRLPTNSTELLISNSGKHILTSKSTTKFAIGETVTLTLNDVKKEYTIVGKIDSSDFDTNSFSGSTIAGAISYLDLTALSSNDIIDMTILAKNVRKIYQTGREIGNILDITSSSQSEKKLTKEEEATLLTNILDGKIEIEAIPPSTMIYNTKLLEYECVWGESNEFSQMLFLIACFLILVLSFVSISMIRLAFQSAYHEHTRELGMLSSLGMNKKQKKKMLRAEVRIWGFLGILLGLFIGIIISFFIISYLSNMLKHIDLSNIITIYENTTLSLHLSVFALLLIIAIICIIIKISSATLLDKLHKINIMEEIKNITQLKITEKQLKHPKWIEKILGEEGVLAYKNIRRDKNKYKIIVESLLISLILFLSISGIVANINKNIKNAETNFDDYTIEISPSNKHNGINIPKIEEIIKYLEDKGLVDSCYASLQPFNPSTITLGENQLSDTTKHLLANNAISLPTNDAGNYCIELEYIWPLGNTYQQILKELGISELKDNEVIISNNITINSKYNQLNYTNFNVGDTYTVDIGKSISHQKATDPKTFCIAGITDNLGQKFITSRMNSTNSVSIIQLNSPATALKLIEEYDYIYLAQIHISTDVKRARDIDDLMKDIKSMYGDKEASVMGCNFLPSDFSLKRDSVEGNEFSRIDVTKLSLINENTIIKILLYSFVCVVVFISILNASSSIYSSIVLRCREFAMLKSIGMNNGQLNKMLACEGIFYGTTILLIGIPISLLVQFCTYLIVSNTTSSCFSPSWLSILGSIIVLYIIIFFSIVYAKRKAVQENMIEIIRNENI